MIDSLELIVSTTNYWPYILVCYGVTIFVFLLNIAFASSQQKKTLAILKQRQILKSVNHVNSP